MWWCCSSVCLHSHSRRSVRRDAPLSVRLADSGTDTDWVVTRDWDTHISFLQQVSVGLREVRAGAEMVMGFFSDRVDSISTCSKKMYLIASSRAKARQITCSTSMVIILQAIKQDSKMMAEFLCSFLLPCSAIPFLKLCLFTSVLNLPF